MDDQRYELVKTDGGSRSTFMSRFLGSDGRNTPWYSRRVFQVGMVVAGGVVLGLIIWVIVRSSTSKTTTNHNTSPVASGQALPASAGDKSPQTNENVTEKYENVVTDKNENTTPHRNENTDPDIRRNPFLYLFATSVDHAVDPNMFDYCSVPPLTYVETLTDGLHTLSVNRTLSRFYFGEAKEFVCCFATISSENYAIAFLRHASGTKGFSNECSFFKDYFTLWFQEAVLVVCGSALGSSIDLRQAEYKHIHHLNTDMSELSDTTPPGRFNWTLRNTNSVNDEKLNFFILGFESEAKSNMMKKMPKTTQFFDEHSFIKLEKFAKISLNASLNKIAVTAGVSLFFARLLCNDGETFSEHLCPLFNNEFRDQGYVEQDTKQSMRYWEPFYTNGTDTCRGPSFIMRLMYDDISSAMEKYEKFYLASVKWMWKITEKDLQHADQLDSVSRESFDAFHRKGVFDNSVVIFMSFNNDTSPTKPTAERNESFVYISLPQKFKAKYPHDMKNLELNAKKMTSPYDLYFTVIDIIKKTTPEGEKKVDLTPCPKCGSLFNPLGSRSCADAAIPSQFCLV